jgi:hypothetical protein
MNSRVRFGLVVKNPHCLQGRYPEFEVRKKTPPNDDLLFFFSHAFSSLGTASLF